MYSKNKRQFTCKCSINDLSKLTSMQKQLHACKHKQTNKHTSKQKKHNWWSRSTLHTKIAGRGVGPQPQDYISKLEDFVCIVN